MLEQPVPVVRGPHVPNQSFSWVKSLELRVVRAMFSRSCLNSAGSSPWSMAEASNAARAALDASRKPATIVMGCTRN